MGLRLRLLCGGLGLGWFGLWLLLRWLLSRRGLLELGRHIGWHWWLRLRFRGLRWRWYKTWLRRAPFMHDPGRKLSLGRRFRFTFLMHNHIWLLWWLLLRRGLRFWLLHRRRRCRRRCLSLLLLGCSSRLCPTLLFLLLFQLLHEQLDKLIRGESRWSLLLHV